MKAHSLTPEFYIAENYNDLLPFLACESMSYDIETYLTSGMVLLTKAGKPRAKQPGHAPWNAKPRLHQFCSPSVREGKPVILDTHTFPLDDLQQILRELFETGERRIYAHYAIFDGAFLYGTYNVFPKNLYCTQVMSQVYWAGLFDGLKQSEDNKTSPFSLASVYKRIAGITIDKELQASDWGAKKLSYNQLLYAANDTKCGYEVGEYLYYQGINAGLFTVMEDERKGMIAFTTAKVNGQVIDFEEMQKIKKEYLVVADQAQEKVKNLLSKPDLNLNSPKQMIKAFAEVGFETTTTSSKFLSQFMTDDNEEDEEETIASISYEKISNSGLTAKQQKIVEALLTYRSVVTGARYLTSMTEVYDFNLGVVHGDFNPMARQGTGRSSCRKPGLQNPARLGTLWKNLGLPPIRKCFKNSDPDWQIISLDSAGCHVQIARSYSHDKKLKEILVKGLDAYITLGVEILRISGVVMSHDEIRKIIKDKLHPDHYRFKEMRQLWKKVFLSRLNGAGAKKIHGELLANDPPIRTFGVEDCKLACDVFDTAFPELAKTQKDLVAQANKRVTVAPFGCWQNYTLSNGNGEKKYFRTNKYAICKSLDGGRYFIPAKYRSWDIDDLNEYSFQGAKPTEVLAFSWQRIEGSCMKLAAYNTVLWLHENGLSDRAWLGNVNHDEMVITAHKDVALTVAIQANQFIEDAFRRYTPDYTDRADIEDKILADWSLKD